MLKRFRPVVNGIGRTSRELYADADTGSNGGVTNHEGEPKTQREAAEQAGISQRQERQARRTAKDPGENFMRWERCGALKKADAHACLSVPPYQSNEQWNRSRRYLTAVEGVLHRWGTPGQK